jgi:glycosyltransferase involved in cell wall biosynthesis
MLVCCLDEAGAWAGELESHGVEVRALGRRPGFHPGLGAQIAGAAREHRATAIHAHHYSPFVYSCLARAWTPGTRVIYTEHGRLSDGPPSGKRRLANRFLVNVPREVYAVSEDLKRHMVSEGFPAATVGVIYNGIDVGPPPSPEARVEARRRLAVCEDVLVIATIARLDPVKDLGTLIRALSIVRQRNMTLVIIGDGPERSALARTADEAGVADRVRFLGQRDDARQWLAGCDLYVNSSVSEGISLTILEAMAAGLPVVATRVGGTPEVIDESCGRLVPARDLHALASTLSDLGAAAAVRSDLGRLGRDRVQRQFTIERMVGAYHDAYERAA